jgi:uncharacterized protein (TIGR03437 family)
LFFDGTSVAITDSKGVVSNAPLFYVAPNEPGFEVPSGVASGAATVTVTGNGSTQTASNIQVAAVAPGLFTLNSAGLATAYAIRVSGGSQIAESVYTTSSAGAIVANPISMGGATDQVYLILYGTGIQAAGTAGVQVTVGGVAAPVLYAGPQGLSPGLDQVNVQLPASLAGKGNVNVQLTAGGVAANPVQVTIQ